MRIKLLIFATVILLSVMGALAENPVSAEQPVSYTEAQLHELDARFSGITYAKTLKPIAYDSPVMTQRFGADPYALVYDDRVYLYMTGDILEYDAAGHVKENSYGKINKLNVVSSTDLINWTDHGSIPAAGIQGAARWGNNSWAPAVACKEINGQMQFFIYFANGGNGIGVLQGDSPTGPFRDPLGHALISRITPNCSSVTWLFDPAVLVDEDNNAYLYFGGGIPNGRVADPGTARVVKLADDMISLAGNPVKLDVPYLFEDSGINKIHDKYYYSYCSNWNVDLDAKRELGIDNAQIVYMISDSPMGPFELGGVVLKNPGSYYGCYGNNHHCMFNFHDKWYIAYHTQMLEALLDISGGYRATSVSEINVNTDGSISTLQNVDRKSLQQVCPFDPYKKTSAATMSTMGGISTRPLDPDNPSGEMVLCDIHRGDWVALRGVDFEDGASNFSLTISGEHAGAVQIKAGKMNGPVIGYVCWEDRNTSSSSTITVKLPQQVSGTTDLMFVFDGEGYTIESWQFEK